MEENGDVEVVEFYTKCNKKTNGFCYSSATILAVSCRVLFTSIYLHKILCQLKKGLDIYISVVQIVPESIQFVLASTNVWCRFLESYDFPCACDFLCHALGVDKFERFGHVITKVSGFLLFEHVFGGCINFESRLIPCINSAVHAVKGGIKQLTPRE